MTARSSAPEPRASATGLPVPEASARGTAAALRTLLKIGPHEGYALALSFLYFALLLASYYTIRPLRDALGAGVGADQIKYLSAAVFVTMLLIVPVFGWLVGRFRRNVLLPAVYAFFVANLLGFAVAFRAFPDDPWVARVFYVWTTVFNLFVVSVFWSFMADLWREEQGRRLFGIIAAGGSLGGLAGPLLTRAVVADVGLAGVALISAGFLACTLVTIVLLARHAGADSALGRARLDEPVGGAILAGLALLARSPFLLGIAALLALGTTGGMFVYIELADHVRQAFATAAERTQFYSLRDLWVNALALVLQLLVVGRLTSRFGVRTTLLVSGAIFVAAFAAIGLAPSLAALAVANVALRTCEFGLAKPSRDMLYTVVDPETKYKVKNVIDTAVYRGSDTVAGFVHAAIVSAGVSLGGIGWSGVVIALLLVALGWGVGTGYRARGGR
jgi:AAA family ATP:ADP antiporter